MEVDGVAGDADGDVGVQLGVFHGGDQLFSIEHVDVEVVRPLPEVAVQHVAQVVGAALAVFAEGGRHDGKGVGDAVPAALVRDLGHGIEGGEGAGKVSVMHGVGAGGEGLARRPAVRRGARLFAVDDVGGNGQNGQRMLRPAVGGRLFQFGRKFCRQLAGDIVGAVVVVAVFGEVSLDGEVFDDAFRVIHGRHLGVFDGGEGIDRHRKARHAAGEEALDFGIVQRHLDLFVGVLVVHVMDDIERVHIQAAQPFHVLVVGGAHRPIVEHARKALAHGAELFAALFVFAAVEGQEQELGEVAPRPEELHLLADLHGGDAAGDAVIVAVDGAHEVVVLVLDGIGVDGDLGAEIFEGLGQPFRPEHGEVGLGRGAEVVQGVQDAERGLGDQRPAVFAHAAHALRRPGGVAAEQLVVFGGAQLAGDAQLEHEVVDQLLRPLFCEDARRDVALDIDIEEGRHPPQTHGGAVLLFDGGEIAEVRPLDRLFGVFGGRGDVDAV